MERAPTEPTSETSQASTTKPEKQTGNKEASRERVRSARQAIVTDAAGADGRSTVQVVAPQDVIQGVPGTLIVGVSVICATAGVVHRPCVSVAVVAPADTVTVPVFRTTRPDTCPPSFSVVPAPDPLGGTFHTSSRTLHDAVASIAIDDFPLKCGVRIAQLSVWVSWTSRVFRTAGEPG